MALPTLGAGVGVLIDTTLGDKVGVLEGGGERFIFGASVGGGGAERGEEFSFHLLKISWRLSMAMSWALMESSVALLMAGERKLITWRNYSS